MKKKNKKKMKKKTIKSPLYSQQSLKNLPHLDR